MLKRVLTAIIALAAFVPILIFSGTAVGRYIFIGLIFILNAFAMIEATKCVGLGKKFWINIPVYVFSAASLIAMVFFGNEQWLSQYGLAAFLTFTFIILAISMLSRGIVRISQTAELLVLAFYITIGFASIVLIKDSTETYGNHLYLLVFLGAWLTDTGAYFVGRLLGKHKLLPTVSPKKTVEGAIGGLVFCVATFVVFGIIVSSINSLKINWLALIIAGVVTSILSQFGDLIMSYLKREHGIKDFSTILPGHGGILDRFDSAIPVSIFLYILNVVCKVMIFYE